MALVRIDFNHARQTTRKRIEPFNLRVKAPFKRGKNCTKRPHLQARLQLQLGCEVRFLNKVEVSVAP